MDFNPDSVKWKCCCCSLPSGMRLLASAELAFCIVTGGLTIYKISQQRREELTALEVCLVGLMLLTALTSVLLIAGIQKHSPRLIYPSLLARGLATMFLAIFGVSAVFSSQKSQGLHTNRYRHDGETTGVGKPESNHMALRLVLFVFAMLFLTVIIFYCSYLVVRLIHYEQSYARLKERRSSLIHAAMIDPDYPTPNTYSSSRRASAA